MDAHLPQILDVLATQRNLVVRAEPGAGKTTRIPPALVRLCAPKQRVVVLEPRRLAARMAAERVAEEGGHTVGGVVGYQMRFENKVSAQTRITFVTEGVLVRQLLSSPTLGDVDVVILDEFHERHIHADVALALLRKLQLGARPDLHLVVMSATLDVGPLSSFLGDCPVLDVPGRVFPVEVTFSVQDELGPTGRPLEKQVADCLRRVTASNERGDVLVFLPGMAEMRRAQEACASTLSSAGLLSCMLHADLSPQEQDRAVRPSTRRKVVFSTNVAESSVTIDGVSFVIDSGLARIPSHDPWSGMPTLRVAKISRASAAQRAGRAGRTRAGCCIRLYTRHDHDSRPEHTLPEVKRLDLAETALLLHGLGHTDLRQFPFFEAPDVNALGGADALLRLLLAVDERGELTPLGRGMLRVPLHPRLGRVWLYGVERGWTKDACVLAAVLAERDAVPPRNASSRVHGSDLLAAVKLVERGIGLDESVVARVERTARQLQGLARGVSTVGTSTTAPPEATLGMAILAGFPDRVAQKRSQSSEYLLCTGGTARLASSSGVGDSPWLVATDAEERTGGKDSGVRILRASEIELDWLIDVAPHALKEGADAVWNAKGERVEVLSRLTYFNLVIEETRAERQQADAAGPLLFRMAQQAGLATLWNMQEVTTLQARVHHLAQAMPEINWWVVNDNQVLETVRDLCRSRTSFKELRQRNLVEDVKARLPGHILDHLEREAPEHIRLPGGRRTQVHYIAGQPPWIQSRLQDFFGMRQTPRILCSGVPLSLHLLAPNMRAVQITNDLEGFWVRVYPAVRKELMRRYPKHPWPENPLTAAPPTPRTPSR
jgi:ATP-dependent helicase HrpB